MNYYVKYCLTKYMSNSAQSSDYETNNMIHTTTTSTSANYNNNRL